MAVMRAASCGVPPDGVWSCCDIHSTGSVRAEITALKGASGKGLIHRAGGDINTAPRVRPWRNW